MAGKKRHPLNWPDLLQVRMTPADQHEAHQSCWRLKVGVEVELQGLQNPSLCIRSCLKVLKSWAGFLLPQAVAEVTAEPGSGVAAAPVGVPVSKGLLKRCWWRVSPAVGEEVRERALWRASGCWNKWCLCPHTCARVGMSAWEWRAAALRWHLSWQFTAGVRYKSTGKPWEGTYGKTPAPPWPLLGRGALPPAAPGGERDTERHRFSSLVANSPRQGGDYSKGETWGGQARTGRLRKLAAGGHGAEQTSWFPEEAAAWSLIQPCLRRRDTAW